MVIIGLQKVEILNFTARNDLGLVLFEFIGIIRGNSGYKKEKEKCWKLINVRALI